MKNDDDTQALDRLCEFLVNDILSTTDEEILKESAEDYASPDDILASVQASIGKARLTVARNKLSNGKTSKFRTESPCIKSTARYSDAQIFRIFEFISSKKDEFKFSLAARKGKELTAQDIRTMLDDLHELGLDLDTLIKGDDE